VPARRELQAQREPVQPERAPEKAIQTYPGRAAASIPALGCYRAAAVSGSRGPQQAVLPPDPPTTTTQQLTRCCTAPHLATTSRQHALTEAPDCCTAASSSHNGSSCGSPRHWGRPAKSTLSHPAGLKPTQQRCLTLTVRAHTARTWPYSEGHRHRHTQTGLRPLHCSRQRS
jgi:hypothetical protein